MDSGTSDKAVVLFNQALIHMRVSLIDSSDSSEGEPDRATLYSVVA